MPTTFILEEDLALKNHLTGLTVMDDRRAQRPVEVWFGQPDLEMRQRTFPYISIDLVDITEANERVMQGELPLLTYIPAGFVRPPNQALTVTQFPTPYDLDYHVSVWSRHPRHDRQIMASLLQGRLPIRFGQLHLPETGRMVRLDMLGGPQIADTTDENGKRLFRKVFTVRVATELFPTHALQAAGLIKEIRVIPPDVPEEETPNLQFINFTVS